MPTLKSPENSAMATSVASDARASTRACIDSEKHIIMVPHVTSMPSSQPVWWASGSSVSSEMPMNSSEPSRKMAGLRLPRQPNRTLPIRPEPPNTSRTSVMACPCRPATCCRKGSR